MEAQEKAAADSGLGSIVKALRQDRGLSLADLGARCGITASTLSKVERGRLSLTYDRLLHLANGLGVSIDQLFRQEERGPAPLAATRRSVSRNGEGEVVETANYKYRYINGDILRKQQNPIVTKISTRTMEEFGEKISHAGEEFTYILKGVVLFVCDYYAPTTLNVGDSIYFDSDMPHAYLCLSEEDAEVLTVCTQP